MLSLGKVAVYGSLRQGMGNHRVLGDSPLLGQARVSGFEMFSLGGFPFVRHGEGDITIEVYEVNEHTSMRVDMLEGYPLFYNREQIDTPYGQAWIYFIDRQETTSPPVTHGDWVAYRTGTHV